MRKSGINVKPNGFFFTRTTEEIRVPTQAPLTVVHINARGTTLCDVDATQSLIDSVRQELGEPSAIPVFHKFRRSV